MNQPIVSFPFDEFLSQEGASDHDELKEKPAVFKPQKQVSTQNDGNWAKPKNPVVPSRPRQKHVKCVREYELRHYKWRIRVYLPPVPAPVSIDAALHRKLDEVYLLYPKPVMQHPASSLDMSSKDR